LGTWPEGRTARKSEIYPTQKETLLKDDEWSQWSNREIARQCEVSRRMVDKYRNGMTVQDEQSICVKEQTAAQ